MRTDPRFADTWRVSAALSALLCAAACGSPTAERDELSVYALTDLPSHTFDGVMAEAREQPFEREPRCRDAQRATPTVRTLVGQLLVDARPAAGKQYVRVTLCQGDEAVVSRTVSTRVRGRTSLDVALSAACVEAECSGAQECIVGGCEASRCGEGLAACELPPQCKAVATDTTDGCSKAACVAGQCLAVGSEGAVHDAGRADAGQAQDAGFDASADAGLRPAVCEGQPRSGQLLYGWTLRSAAEAQDPEVLQALRSQGASALRVQARFDPGLWGQTRDWAALDAALEAAEGMTLLVQLTPSSDQWHEALFGAGSSYNAFREDELRVFEMAIATLVARARDHGVAEIIVGAFYRPHQATVYVDFSGQGTLTANETSAWPGHKNGVSATWWGGTGTLWEGLHDTARQVDGVGRLSSSGVDIRGFLPSHHVFYADEQGRLRTWVARTAALTDLVDLHRRLDALPEADGDAQPFVQDVLASVNAFDANNAGVDFLLGEVQVAAGESLPLDAAAAARLRSGLCALAEAQPQHFQGLILNAPPVPGQPGWWSEDYAP